MFPIPIIKAETGYKGLVIRESGSFPKNIIIQCMDHMSHTIHVSLGSSPCLEKNEIS